LALGSGLAENGKLGWSARAAVLPTRWERQRCDSAEQKKKMRRLRCQGKCCYRAGPLASGRGGVWAGARYRVADETLGGIEEKDDDEEGVGC
jgi:hypothetical protein